MALPPFWLDEVFSQPEHEKAFMKHGTVVVAFAAAKAAYLQSQEIYRKNPGLCGTTPEQAARGAFIEALELHQNLE